MMKNDYDVPRWTRRVDWGPFTAMWCGYWAGLCIRKWGDVLLVFPNVRPAVAERIEGHKRYVRLFGFRLSVDRECNGYIGGC